MTLAELRTKANAKLAELWPIIQAKEDAYFAKHGQYFGIRWSPSVKVVDGVDTDLTIEYPSKGIFAQDVSFDATTVPFQITIHRINQQPPRNTAQRTPGETAPTPVYAPTGETYQAFVRIELPNGEVWFRNRLQDNTDSGWYQQTELI